MILFDNWINNCDILSQVTEVAFCGKGIAMPRIKEFLAEESGLSAVEYGLVLGIISMASVVAWDAMGNTLENVYGDLASDVEQSS